MGTGDPNHDANNRGERAVPLELRPALLPIARRVFWWGTPEEWLEDKVRFAAQVMTYGDLEDVRITSTVLGDAVFVQVLDDAPAGVFDIKSWTFWHVRFGRKVPSLPKRRI